DLIVLNADSVKLDWGSPQKWLGTLLSMGNGGFITSVQNLTAQYGVTVVGVSDFAVADYNGTRDWDDLFLFGANDLLLMRSMRSGYMLETYYPWWIHNHRWHGL